MTFDCYIVLKSGSEDVFERLTSRVNGRRKDKRSVVRLIVKISV